MVSSNSFCSSSGIPQTPPPSDQAGFDYYSWPAYPDPQSSASSDQRRLAFNLDLVPDEEPLMHEIIRCLSSTHSRLSLAQADNDFTPNTHGVQSGSDEIGVMDFTHALAFELGLSIGSARHASALSSIDDYADSDYSADPAFTMITSSHHHQMIRDLETSQAIDLSHLTGLTEQSDSDDFLVPVGSSATNLRDILLLSSSYADRRPLSMSDWLNMSISRIRRSRNASIDEVLSSQAEHGRVGPSANAMPDLRENASKPHGKSGGTECSVNMGGWQRLRSFLLRRRSI